MRREYRCDGTGQPVDYVTWGSASCPGCDRMMAPANIRRDGTVRPHGTWELVHPERVA